MSLAEENRKDIVAYRIERAYTALEQAKLNFKLNCLEVKYTVGTDPTVYIGISAALTTIFSMSCSVRA